MNAIHQLLKSYNTTFFVLNEKLQLKGRHGIESRDDKLIISKNDFTHSIDTQELCQHLPVVSYQPILIKLPVIGKGNNKHILFTYCIKFQDKKSEDNYVFVIQDTDILEGLDVFHTNKKLQILITALKFVNQDKYLGNYITNDQYQIKSIEEKLSGEFHYKSRELYNKHISHILPKSRTISYIMSLDDFKSDWDIKTNKVLFKCRDGRTQIYNKIDIPLNRHGKQVLHLVSQIKEDVELLNSYNEKEKATTKELQNELIVKTTTEGIINWASRAFLSLTGYSIEEVIGENMLMFCGKKTNMEAVEEMLSHFSKHTTPYEFKVDFYKKNGSTFKTFQRVEGVFNDQNELKGYKITIENISQIYYNTRKLKQLIHVCNLLHESVVITNAKGRTEWVNKEFEQKTEYTLEELKGKTPGSVLQGEGTNQDDIESFKTKLKEEKPFTQTILNYSKSGKKYIATIEITPIKNKSGEITNFIGIQQFVSDTHKQNEKQSKDMVLEVMQELSLQYEALTKKQEEIEVQNNTLKEAYKLLETLNHKVNHSINYAQKLQSSIIPNQFFIERKLGNAFIINKPKDIVSGDFYWFYETPLWQRVVVGDCTGHGIPGAFMTIMATSLLDQFIKNCELEDIPEAFNQLNTYIKNKLMSDTKSVDGASVDGFEFGFLQLNKNNDTYHYLGSKMDLIKINKEGIERVKAHKFPIGGSIKFYDDKRFHEIHTFQTKQDEFVFLHSDGIPDQFDNTNKLKYTSKKLRSFLHSNIDLPIEDQRNAVLKEIKKWKGKQPQTDDIILLGLMPHMQKKYKRISQEVEVNK